jgi:hypothetical protein
MACYPLQERFFCHPLQIFHKILFFQCLNECLPTISITRLQLLYLLTNLWDHSEFKACNHLFLENPTQFYLSCVESDVPRYIPSIRLVKPINNGMQCLCCQHLPPLCNLLLLHDQVYCFKDPYSTFIWYHTLSSGLPIQWPSRLSTRIPSRSSLMIHRSPFHTNTNFYHSGCLYVGFTKDVVRNCLPIRKNTRLLAVADVGTGRRVVGPCMNGHLFTPGLKVWSSSSSSF